MNSQLRHTNILKSSAGGTGNLNAPPNVMGQGGRPRTMILGMAAVAAGLGAFWLLQFKVQDSSNPSQMPTWQFRHAQQVPEFKARTSIPGGKSAAVYNSQSTATGMPASAAGVRSGGTVETQNGGRGSEHGGSGQDAAFDSADPRGMDSHAERKRVDGEKGDKGIIASIMTALQGDSNRENQSPVGQPAPTRRLNDRGVMYTKKSEYKDGYRRD